MNSPESYIDHTHLKPDASWAQIEKICREAKEFQFAAVCVNPIFIKRVAQLLNDSRVLPITVVGFPLGANTTALKTDETLQCIELGAKEIDMVIPYGELKAGNDSYVGDEISAIVQASGKIPVKVILETAALTDDEIIRGCKLSAKAGAAFVKTSTGFGPGGAKAEHVALMRKTVGPSMGVKASGGIRSLEDFEKMIQAGASRVGSSSSVSIINAYREAYGNKV